MPNPLAKVATGKNFVRLQNFSRGENRKSDVYDLPKGWLNGCKNWYLSEDGSLIMRRGTVQWNVRSLGPGAARGSTRAYPSNGNLPFFLACRGTAVYVGNDVNQTFASSLAPVDASASYWFTQSLNYVYASNGVTPHQKMDANTQLWTQWGVAAPTTAPRALAGGTGSLSGTYKFKTTFLLASGIESNGGPATSVVVLYDNFNRPDSDSMGGTWTEREAATGAANPAKVFTLKSNALRVRSTDQNVASIQGFSQISSDSYYHVYVQATLVGWLTVTQLTRACLAVRMSGTPTSFTGYVLETTPANATTMNLKLRKYVAQTLVGEGTSINASVGTAVAGDVLRLEVEDTTLRVYKNGTLLSTDTDSSIASGTLGVASIFVSVAADEDSWTDFDNYEAGTLETTVSSKVINLTAIPTGSADVVKRRIYGFKKSVSSIYQLVAEIGDNVTTTLTVNADQDRWLTEIPTDNDPPPAKAWISALHKGRIWMAGDPDNPLRLYFSKINIPQSALEAFPLTAFLDIPMRQGDKITALVPQGDVIYVFGNDSVFYVVGETALTFAYRHTYATSGAPGPWAVDKITTLSQFGQSFETVIFLSRNGVMTISGLNTVYVSEAEESLFSDLPESSVGKINYAFADKATLKFYDRLKGVYVSFPVGDSKVNNFAAWWFVSNRGFVEDSRPGRQMLTLAIYDKDGKAFLWDAGEGLLREIDVDKVYTDDGAPIVSVIDTGFMSGGQFVQELTKIWQWVTAVTDSSAVSVKVTASVDESSEIETFSMKTNVDERLGGKMRGRRLRLVMSFTASAFFRLSQLAIRFTQTKAFRPRG